ncbi:MAG: SoxR reducing system RseC family protein [Firmicutes bacterium]|nr:SoxR reducing system RseC family protein [Bacillota bacterium]
MAGILREIGQVTEVLDTKVKVMVTRSSSCENCGACGIGAKPTTDFMLNNNIGAKVGDRVVIELHSKALFKAAFLVYAIPLVALIIGFLLGQRIGTSGGMTPNQAELTGIGSGFLFLVLAFLSLRKLERLRAFGSDLQPQLVAVVDAEESSC